MRSDRLGLLAGHASTVMKTAGSLAPPGDGVSSPNMLCSDQ